MEFSAWVYLIAPLVVFAGYTAFGISGFGSTIIVVPILAQFLALKFVVPLMVLLDLSAILIMRANKGLQARDMKEVGSMLPFMLIGMVLGLLIKERSRALPDASPWPVCSGVCTHHTAAQ